MNWEVLFREAEFSRRALAYVVGIFEHDLKQLLPDYVLNIVIRDVAAGPSVTTSDGMLLKYNEWRDYLTVGMGMVFRAVDSFTDWNFHPWPKLEEFYNAVSAKHTEIIHVYKRFDETKHKSRNIYLLHLFTEHCRSSSIFFTDLKRRLTK